MKKAVAILAGIVLLSSCTAHVSDKNVTISQGDVTSLSTQLVDSPQVKRVVALSNGSAEILLAMGLKKIIVGRDIASTEDALKDIEIVTSGHQINAEKVISLHPDIVLIDASSGPAPALSAIASAGIRLIKIPEAWTLTDIEKKVRAIGASVGAPSTAENLVTAMNSSIDKSKSATKKNLKALFLYLRGTNAIYLVGGPKSGADSLFQAIGVRDVGAETLKNPFSSLTAEAIIAANPDIIVVMTHGLESVGGMDGLLQLPGVKQTSAGKNRRVIDVDDSLLLSFGPRTPSLLMRLSEAVNTVAG